MLIAVHFYLESDVGIVVNFDDAFYAASIVNQVFYLKMIPWGAASFGFAALGRIFYVLTGNLFTATTAMPITAIMLTMITLYIIGKKYGGGLAGLSSAVLFAFNPLVYAYSIRLLPDIFITMLLSFAILITVYAERKSYGYFIGGIVAGLGVFFGLQVFLSLLAYFALVASLVYVEKLKGKTKKIFCAFIGMALAITLFLLFQDMIYGNPLFAINEMETFNSEYMSAPLHNNYYFNVLFPESHVGYLPGSGSEPYSTLGMLSIVFIGANVALLYKKRFNIVPYTFSSIAFVLYVLFGTQSISMYYPILHMNRLLMPIVLLFSIGSGMSAGLAKSRVHAVAAIAFLAFYVFVSFQYYTYAARYYDFTNRNPYLATEQVSNYLNTMDLKGYSIHENVTELPILLCASLKTSPVVCNGGPGPVEGINCTENNTIFLLDVPYCGSTYIFSNKSLGYYIYKN